MKVITEETLELELVIHKELYDFVREKFPYQAIAITKFLLQNKQEIENLFYYGRVNVNNYPQNRILK